MRNAKMTDGTIETWKVTETILAGRVCELRIPVYREQGGALVREARRRRGFGLRQAAELVGLGVTELSYIETGRLVLEDVSELLRAIDGVKAEPWASENE